MTLSLSCASIMLLLSFAALCWSAPATQPLNEPDDEQPPTTMPQKNAFRDPTTNPAIREGNLRHRRRVDALQGVAPPALAVDHWLNSERLDLSQLKGRVVLLDFFKPDGPSTVAMPYTNQLLERYGKEGLVIIAISCSDDAAATAASVEQRRLRYPIASDTTGKTAEAYHVDSFPDYYLIDRSGRLRVADCKNGEVENLLMWLLKENADDPPR